MWYEEFTIFINPMKKFILLLMLTACLAACEIKPSLMKTWKITKVEIAETDTLSDKLYQDAYLSFYEDGSLSFYQKYGDEKGYHALYRIGKWNEHGSGIDVSLDRMDFKHRLNITELTSEWLILEFTEGDPSLAGTQLKCQASTHFSTSSEDLLNPANNTWRIKPGQKETAQEIETRVINHVQYLIRYFALVETKKQGYFETTHLQTPLKFYSNGLSLPQEFITNNGWVSYFYDEADAQAGGKLLLKSFSSMEEFPASEKSYTKGYHDALVMMKDYLVK